MRALLLLFLFPAYALAADEHDTAQPIDITADQLEVVQPESKAIFTGNVVAIQGTIKLKADKMTVFYKKKDGAASTSGTPEASSISKVEALGNVFLSRPEETATGARGLYDVDKKMLWLNDNVVLTRAQNVLKGKQLEYNMQTGRSVVTSDTAVPGGGGRVHGLFVPEKKKN